MTLKIRTVRLSARTTVGTQDFTVPGFGTPKAAMFFASLATVSGTAANHGGVGWGFTDGIRNRATLSKVKHGGASEDARRLLANDACIMLAQASGTAVDCYADFDSWIPNGVRINWQNAPGSAWIVTCVLFTGSDLSAYVGDDTVVGDTTLDVTAPGADADLTFLISSYAGMSTAAGNTTVANATTTFAWGVHTGAGLNRGKILAWGADHGDTAGAPYSELGANSVLMNLFEGETFGERTWAQITNGFRLTSVDTGGIDFAYLSLNFNGNFHGDAGEFSSPGVGDEVVTRPGWKPQFVMMAGSMDPVINERQNGVTNASTLAIGMSDGVNDFCHSITDENDAPTTNTQSLVDAKLIQIPDATGDVATGGDQATLKSLDAVGFTADFDEANLDGTTIWLAIEGKTPITGSTTSGRGQLYQSTVSDPADPSSNTVELAIDPAPSHCFLGVQMFDSAGDPIAAAATGSFAVAVKTLNSQQFEAPPDPTIDATDPKTINFAGNITAVRVTPSSVAGNDITTWRVVVTCNRN